jgi:vacuolar-type H+-ATPase subunit F/Vma7
MSSLNFTITATQAEFDDFANRLGYQAFTVDELDVPIPNPETRNAFLQRILKEKVANTFYTPFVTEIDSQISTARDSEKETMRTTVRDRVGVTFTV